MIADILKCARFRNDKQIIEESHIVYYMIEGIRCQSVLNNSLEEFDYGGFS